MGALTTAADRSVAKLTEEELIRRVVQSLAEAAPAFPEGPGGDCAHLPTTGGRSIRASTIDSVILGRHFDAACDGIRAGAKLVNRNLSDLAAAGAVPSDALNSVGSVADLKCGWLRCLSLANSSLLRMGCFNSMSRQLSGCGLSRLRSEPMVVSALVTISSRMQSMGGFVTCAKSCLK